MNRILYRRMDRQTNMCNNSVYNSIINDFNVIKTSNTSNTLSIPKISFQGEAPQKFSNVKVEHGR